MAVPESAQAECVAPQPAGDAPEGPRERAGDGEDEADESDESWGSDYEGYYDVKQSKDPSRAGVPHGNDGQASAAMKQAYLQRLHAHVNFDSLPARSSMSHAAKNSIAASEKKNAEFKHQGLTKESRATVEQVLDQRTMLVLSKFLKRGLFSEIHGCISTGKEANVYYATAPDGVERAVKVYKTSILVFKDRSRYVEGEYRFRHGYCKGNPRKMVAQWAEKEMRNLKRLRASGVRCPEVVEVRQNVLVMEFIGEDSAAAPRLKDVGGLGPDDWLRLYTECAVTMRRMMQHCRLVHGDLSEYNMLYHAGELYIIDVSQSVERDHPRSLDFLKRDCVNVNNFFTKMMGHPPVPVKLLFDYIVTRELAGYGPGQDTEAFQGLLTAAAEGQDDAEDDEVFLQTWIPTCLDQVNDRAFIERELERREQGEELLYERLLVPNEGPEADAAAGEGAPGAAGDREGDSEDEGSSDGSSDAGAEDGEGGDAPGRPQQDGHRPEGVDKHEWKAKVKEEKREKRKDKIPKSTKKKYRKKAAKGH
mmetsp:Transcript_91177/g.258198  ORF Transcript_91177/g.258198 Transcript_91177/m.258198 type:complete len:533 (+) Transcript_91177:109-1707(+)